MYSIGEFAALGRVSARMLRHYDGIGLLTPAAVDPTTGYRSYGDRELERLNRIMVFRDLGFTLDEVARIVDGADRDELLSLLRRRRDELVAAVSADALRVGRIEARLRSLEGKELMSTITIQLSALPALHLVEGSTEVADFSDIGPAVGPLFDRVGKALESAGVQPAGPAVAYYTAFGEGVGIHAAFPVPADVTSVPGLDVVDLGAEAEAATAVHEGDMSSIKSSWDALMDWVDQQGYVVSGSSREVYTVMTAQPEQWRTELQLPVRRA